jgi:hypothetical protein
MAYSVEHVTEVWDDNDGSKIEIGPDRDGLDLVEIREKDSQGKIVNRLVLKQDQAKLVAQALLEVLERG